MEVRIMDIRHEIDLVRNNLVSASTSMSGILKKSGRYITKDTNVALEKIARTINVAISKLEEIEKTIK